MDRIKNFRIGNPSSLIMVIRKSDESRKNVLTRINGIKGWTGLESLESVTHLL